MQSFFDEVIDRANTASLKWDRYGSKDVIPLWVADMDFRAPPAVVQALQARVAHGVFGYTLVPPELVDAVLADVQNSFGWNIQKDWLVWIPGLVSGLNIACRAVGNEGDEVITFTPVYPPFLETPRLAGRKLVDIPLQQEGVGGTWNIDFAALEHCVNSQTRQLLLCNPHNPVGRVFSRDELTRLANFCIAHKLTLCSDEIHNGLLLGSHCHTCIASLSPEIANASITLMAPSKTYNIPGLACSFAIIPNATLRKQFHAVMRGIVPHVNLLGFTAALACYGESQDWHSELLDYLRGNYELLCSTLAPFPQLALTPLEATYLAWIDCRALDLKGHANPARFFENAGVGLSDGAEFGLPGFVRLNFGCPRSLLEQALQRIVRALQTENIT